MIWTHLDAAVQNSIQEVKQVLLLFGRAWRQEVGIDGEINHNKGRQGDLTATNKRRDVTQLTPAGGHR